MVLSSKYSVSLQKILDDHTFEEIYIPKNPGDIYITSQDVNRPGFVFAGYTDHFVSDRVQFFGLAEKGYLESVGEERSRICLERLLSMRPALIIVTRGLELPDGLLELSQRYSVPILRSRDTTSACMAEIIAYLGVELAERITRHGVLVEVSGEGVLILGDSGVGKSETALELLKRGHRLIADDAVEIRRVSARTLVGSAPDNIRHYIELRGVGIINARRIFGTGAVKVAEKIDMVVKLEQWNKDKVYDRLGVEEEFANILGIRVPMTVVPVKPGRNLSIIIETAAINNRQKQMGYNAARELMHQLGMSDDIVPDEKELEAWGTV